MTEWFANIVRFIIAVSVITTMLDMHPPPPVDMRAFLEVCNLTFAAVCAVETVILLIALGSRRLHPTALTAFDGVVVISSWFGIVLDGAAP